MLAIALPRLPGGEILASPLVSLAAVLIALTLIGAFAVLRSALLHSVPARVLEGAHGALERDRLRPLLERADELATAASLFEFAFQILFLVLVLATAGGTRTGWPDLGFAVLVSVPLLVLASEVVPSALRGDPSDALLRRTLPTFDVLQRPLAGVTFLLEGARLVVMKAFRIPERSRGARRIVEDLRDVIEDSTRESELRESEREIIENVVEFHDVHVAEVMTPRTELTAVEISSGVKEAVRAIAETGHSRVLVYEDDLDAIIGVAYAQEILALVARGELEQADLRRLLRPVRFVPETKRLSEVLDEFRRDKLKMAVVVDEYGGTSGVVTLGDVVKELVGGMREELGEARGDPIRRHADGTVEIDASARVSMVNDELDLELPDEEDFETLAGFVLAELGHFPRRGEAFLWNGVLFTVTEASDRRVFKVRLVLPAPEKVA